MLCQFEKLIYPRTAKEVAPDSFMIAIYSPCGVVKDSAGLTVKQIKAVGFALPVGKKQKYDLQGHWAKDDRHGIQFQVDSYDEVITQTKEGIIAYLSSGQIKGIGPKTAERIYESFGQSALDILDNDPEQFLTISGISERKLKRICESYMANRVARDVVAFLLPYGITVNRAVKLYKEYGKKTLNVVKNHPYQMCELAGVGFKTADQIAQNMGMPLMSPERVDEAMLYTLTNAETKGHLCMEKHEFIQETLKILDIPQLTEEMAANRAARMVFSGKLVSYKDKVYRSKTAYAEIHLAERISRMVGTITKHPYGDLDKELLNVEQRMKMQLAPEQKEAVKMALTEGISIITGGPGTGKTLIQRVILDIYMRMHEDCEICCCAPTGRAARRMEQSTGQPSSTVHKVLCIGAGDDGEYMQFSTKTIDAGLILVDEASMLDVYLAGNLVDAVKKGAQLVLIGDSDQLPSVGPGAVLKELIDSNRIPVVRLDTVFRQNAGSLIARNAKRIRHGDSKLEYGMDFQFVESVDMKESAEIITRLYMDEVEKYGIDNVALLTPYRQKTETSVNALNTCVQSMVFTEPPENEKFQLMNRVFLEGDKVMQMKNFEDVNNGDIGYIRKIIKTDEENLVDVDFGDGREKRYDSQDIDMLDLGYASTIHKSQGSEYSSVIINLQFAHNVMLTRPLIYTAITRGKERVIIVGERRALHIAVKRTDTEQRGTCLASRLQELI